MFNQIVLFTFATIIFAGILGNLNNLTVFAKKKLWKYFTFRLIFYLSFVDLVILILCGIELLVELQFDIDIRVISTIICKVDTFLAYFLWHLRTILSMAILIKRKIFRLLIYLWLGRLRSV